MKVSRLLAAATALVATGAHAQGIERKINSPTATISSSVSIPANARLFYLSGSVGSPLDPAKPDELGDTKAQTLSVLTKMKAALEGLGLTMGDVVKMNVFLVADPKLGKMDSPAMNEVFRTFFGTAEQPNRPARSTVAVAALGRPAILVEIEAIAAKVP